MRDWLAARTPRERRALLLGAALLALVGAHAGIWSPLAQALERNRALVQEQRETLTWMQQAAREIAALRAAAPGDGALTPASQQALVAFLERSARDAGLAQRVTRMEPVGNDRVQLTLEEAPFDGLIAWLAALHGPGQPQPSALSVTRTPRDGIVDATLTLERPKGGG